MENGSGKKWKEKPVGKKAWSILAKMEKMPGVFLGLINIKINDEAKLTDYLK